MQVFHFEQYSHLWWEQRRGVPTASLFHKIITPKQGKLSAQADDLICELIADQVGPYPPVDPETFRTAEMQHGIDTEAEARSYYSLATGMDVRQVGFCLSDDSRFGCSPDGLVGDEGGLELKCPSVKTQVAYLLAGELPPEYRPQVHGSLIVTGRQWWDFMSYAKDLPPLLIRVYPDEYTEQLRLALEEFWWRYQAALGKIAALCPSEEIAA